MILKFYEKDLKYYFSQKNFTIILLFAYIIFKAINKKGLNLRLHFIRLYCSSLIDVVLRLFECLFATFQTVDTTCKGFTTCTLVDFILTPLTRTLSLFLRLSHEKDLWRKVRLSFLTTFPSPCKYVSIVVYGTTCA